MKIREIIYFTYEKIHAKHKLRKSTNILSRSFFSDFLSMVGDNPDIICRRVGFLSYATSAYTT